jgi:hypothetical protein
MMRIWGVLLAVVALVAVAPAECLAIEVADAVICRDVIEREPVDAGEVFSADVAKVWCWSKIKDGKGTKIKHAYYYEGEQKAVVELAIGAPLWRTYSSKRILSSWTGQWRVDILDEEGQVLKSLEFTIVE